MPTIADIIRRKAARRNLDPRAVLAVAAGEGGITRPRGMDQIGDKAGGGSYGPFQLYAQGALPQRLRGNARAAQQWAWSPAGIDYALRKMTEVGAAGQRGTQAINTIVRKFERPFDPNKSVRLAVSRYGQFSGRIPPPRATNFGKRKNPGGKAIPRTIPGINVDAGSLQRDRMAVVRYAMDAAQSYAMGTDDDGP